MTARHSVFDDAVKSVVPVNTVLAEVSTGLPPVYSIDRFLGSDRIDITLKPILRRFACCFVEEEYAGPGIVLSAAAGNGIVAADGGPAWPGAADVELPFP